MQVSIDGSLPITVPADTEEEAVRIAMREAQERGYENVTEDKIEVIEK